MIKEFVVISDTHGLGYEIIENLLPVINSVDALVHLGDGLGDLTPFREQIKCDIIEVRGNCDTFSDAPEISFVQTPAGKVMFTHGYAQKVDRGLLNLCLSAREHGCRYAFFGHTHTPCEEETLGVTMINPGSACRPRLSNPSYAVVFSEKENLISKIVPLPPKNR